MTEQERKYFDRLAKRREQYAETINDPEFRSGFESSMVFLRSVMRFEARIKL